MEVLLDAGANCFAVDRQLFSCLSWAVYNNNVPMLHMLIARGGSAKDPQLLQIAEANRSFDVMSLLAKNGARLKGPEMVATLIRSREAKLIPPLLHCLDTATAMKIHDNCNILHAACNLKTDESLIIAKMILDAFPDFDVDALDNDGRPPLAAACEGPGIDLVRFLLERGASIDRLIQWYPAFAANRECTKQSPLCYAAQTDNLPLVSLLLRHGANVDATDSLQGRTPLHFAVMRLHHAFVDLSDDSNDHDDVSRAPEICRMLVHAGCALDVKTKDKKRTVLHYACKPKYQAEGSNARFLEMLGRNPRGTKFDVNAQDAVGKTALHLAAKVTPGGEGARMCSWLLEFGAVWTIRDAKGRTAADCAASDEVKAVFAELKGRDATVLPLMSLCAGVIRR
ncbi:hypothetical protein HK104_005110 [Borealophlyctis nickersoniae]|nr:hypothetical protein HK104_005110 [Borealophlyctis nickersoniae]